MCGIVAIWSYDEPPRSDELEEILSLIRHRGPDDQGFCFPVPEIGLGSTRLAVIDISEAGHQPMQDDKTGNTIVYNGEIYNYVELRTILTRAGHHFRTHTDTEVVLKAYLEWGVNCLRHFRGMFGLVLWDAVRRRLFVARDRLGVKQLYYFQDDHRLMIGSEIKTLMPYLWETGTVSLNEAALPYYLTMRCVPTDGTLVQGIKRLEAGTFLLIDEPGRRVQKSTYWSLDDFALEREISEHDALNDLRHLIPQAVRRRLVADVPVGCFLSGGLDSSLVAVLASRNYERGEFHTFSVDFEDKALSERPFFDQVARHIGSNHHVVSVGATDFLRFLDDWVFFMDDLVSDPSSLPLYYVACLARDLGVKVVLSGEGADELFGGYETYLRTLRWRGWRVPIRVLNGFGVGKFLRDPDHRAFVSQLGWRHSFRGTAYVFGESERQQYLKTDGSLDPWLSDIFRRGRDLSFTNRMMFLDMVSRIPSDLLVRTDRVTMAASVECRVPFLDHELVENVVGIDGRLKISKQTSKYLLKRFASEYLPNAIVDRPKVGFSVPIGSWFRNELRPLLERIFVDEQMISALDYGAVEKLLDDQARGRKGCEARLWNLLALELWCRRWIWRQPLIVETR
jgi:asparagine synthase (glutamine-hydrolysing)